MPKEKTVKGEMYRNEDKIKIKTRVDNLGFKAGILGYSISEMKAHKK